MDVLLTVTSKDGSREVRKLMAALRRKGLTSKDRVALCRESFPAMSSTQISKVIGISRERVRQLLEALGLPTRVEGELRGGYRERRQRKETRRYRQDGQPRCQGLSSQTGDQCRAIAVDGPFCRWHK